MPGVVSSPGGQNHQRLRTISMPPTPRQKPSGLSQRRAQAAGLRFPIARVLVVISLAVGHGVGGRVRAVSRRGTGELHCSARSSVKFQPCDIALADRGFFGAFWSIAAWQSRT